ncbi:MAG: RNA polymerase sigma factor RpoD/SigA [Methylococcales bacterium]|nr:RNA polymerase sigma factor RpoD/SigA [Methylococcales bacterium]
MAYLNARLSIDKLAGCVAESAPVETEQLTSYINNEADNTENSNFQIARLLKEQKSKLINALSQFPVTALWLLNEYEQTCEQNDEAASSTELTTALADIKKYFLVLFRKKSNNAAYTLDKHNLATALQLFPFTFKDLVKLVDIIVYAYKSRGLYRQFLEHSFEDDQYLIIERLEAVNGRIDIDVSKWLDLSEAGYSEEFLFLSSGSMHKYFVGIVISEHSWLKTRQQLASANSRLVLFIANHYKGKFLDFDDLVQEGQAGLLKAVDKFDYGLGFQFSTYAGYWIRQAMSRSLSRSERVVRIPCGQLSNINKAFRIKDQFTAQTGRQPSINELAENARLSNGEINALLSISQTAVPFDGFEDEENSFAPIDFLEQQIFIHPFIKIAQSDLEKLISKAIKILNPREAKVICWHFGVASDNPMTLQEIGAELNLTRERVRQIQVTALDKIKRSFGEQLMCFL